MNPHTPIRTLALALAIPLATLATAGCESAFGPLLEVAVEIGAFAGGQGRVLIPATATEWTQCDSVCTTTFPDAGLGGRFSVTAIPDDGYVFERWVDRSCTIANEPASPSRCSVDCGPGDGNAECRLFFASVIDEPTFRLTPSFSRDVPGGFVRSVVAVVPDPVEIDFDASGNLYVADSGASRGNAPTGPIRRVTPEGVVSEFGDSIADPDALIVDLDGQIAKESGSVIVGGSFDFANDSSELTVVAPNGSTRRILLGTAPALSNPSSFAFLPEDGGLLVANFGSNGLSRVRREGGGIVAEPFYQATDTTSGMISVEVLEGTIWVITGAGRLRAVSAEGAVVADDVWPTSDPASPAKLVADTFGRFGNRLLVATDDGRVLGFDPAGRTFERIGDFTFDNPIFGMAISPLDGALYLSDSATGEIWRVEPRS